MTTGEWGVFNDEAENYTAEQAVEAGFYSQEEAEEARKDRYADDDECVVRECEAEEDEDDIDEDSEETDEDGDEGDDC